MATAELLPGFRGTRGEVVRAIKRLQTATAREIASSLGLTPNALRRHLKELESSGIITHSAEVRGVGAPVHAYRLSESGERLFPSNHEAFLDQALTVLKEYGGTAAVTQVFARRFDELAATSKAVLADMPLAERTRHLATLLSSLGHMAEASADDGALLREYHCAVKSVAERFPELCEAEGRFIEEMLGVPVERHEHLATGGRCCAYCVAGTPSTHTPPALARHNENR